MIRWLTEQTLTGQLRRVFLFLMTAMLVLLAFQVTQAYNILRTELSKGKHHMEQVLDRWLEAERLLTNYKRTGAQAYTQALSQYLENGREAAITPALSQLVRQYDLTGAAFLSEEGEGWNHVGEFLEEAGLPAWMTQVPSGQVMFRIVRKPSDNRLLEPLFSRPGLYAVVCQTVSYDIGENAGELVFVTRLAEADASVTVLEKLLGSPRVVLTLQPEKWATPGHVFTILGILLQETLSTQLKVPGEVLNGERSAFIVDMDTDFYANFVQSAMFAMLVPFAVFFFILLGFYYYLNKHVVAPMNVLARTFRRYRHGELNVRMPQDVSAPQEIRYVAEQTNRTLDELARQTQALHDINASLEQQVAERTRQLEKANAELRKVAFTDSLTGLYNRLGLEHYWRAHFEQPDHPAVALALLNIDLFRDINETYGTEVANRVLKVVGKEVSTRCGNEVLAYRLGGDEFAILFPSEHFSPEKVQNCLEYMVNHFAGTTLEAIGMPATLSLSVGWVWVPENAEWPFSSALRDADRALRAAKVSLDDKVQRFDMRRHHHAGQYDLEQVEKVRRLVRTGEGLMLFRQPLVDARTGEWRYVEVLARFAPEPGREMSPGEFFPMIERLHLEPAFDRLVIRKVAEQLGRGCTQVGGVSVNLAAETLEHEALYEWLEPLSKVTDRYKVVLEITESTLVKDLKAAQEKLLHLRQMGFKVAIDDFGSGYSSVSYLAHLSADIIKFDMSLARAACQDSRSERIILGLARELHSLGYEVVFEGIEDQNMASFFKRPYVDYLQGYHFSMPLACDVLCSPISSSSPM